MIEKRMELTDGVYERFLKYRKKNGFGHDSGAIYHLLQELKYTENDILDIVQWTVISIVDASEVLSEDDLEKKDSLAHYLCDCSKCDKEKCLAHTDCKGSIAVSRKHFTDLLQRGILVPVGLLDLMYSYLHEVVHNIYPDAPKDVPVDGQMTCSRFVQEKTKEIWCKGMVKMCDHIEPSPESAD